MAKALPAFGAIFMDLVFLLTYQPDQAVSRQTRIVRNLRTKHARRAYRVTSARLAMANRGSALDNVPPAIMIQHQLSLP